MPTPPPADIQQAQGQTPAPAPATTTQPARPIIGWFQREDRPVISRIQGWFKRDQKDAPKDIPTSNSGNSVVIRENPVPPANATTPTAPSNDFYRKLPQPQSKGTAPSDANAMDTSAASSGIQQVSLQQTALPKNGKSPILPQFANRIGRDEKFEWITGQVEMENGNMVLYYSLPEVVDLYHGRVILLPQQADLKQFKTGDMVSKVRDPSSYRARRAQESCRSIASLMRT